MRLSFSNAKANDSLWEMEGGMFKASPLVDICNGNDTLRPHNKERKVPLALDRNNRIIVVYSKQQSSNTGAGVATRAHVHQQRQQVHSWPKQCICSPVYNVCSILRPTSAALSRVSETEGQLQHSRCPSTNSNFTTENT